VLVLLLALVFVGGWSQPLRAFFCPFSVSTGHCAPSAEGVPGGQHPYTSHEHDATHSDQEGPAAGPAAASSGDFFCDMVSCVQCHPPLAGPVSTFAIIPAGVAQAPQYWQTRLPSPLPSEVFRPPSLFSLLAI
jgi:hypothetical protein